MEREKMENLEKMRNELRYEQFYYQRRNADASYKMIGEFGERFFKVCSYFEEHVKNDDPWKLIPPSLGDAKSYTEEEFYDIIHGYEPDSFICKTWCGSLHRGSITNGDGSQCDVTVKIWSFKYPSTKEYAEYPTRFCNELEMLISEDPHPCLMKLRGFCCQRILAIVYDGGPSEILRNELSYGIGLDDRIKIATQLAGLLIWSHGKGFGIARSQISSYTMIDKGLNTRVFDFLPIIRVKEVDGASSSKKEMDKPTDGPTLKDDVRGFGELLVELFTKKERKVAPSYLWIREQLKNEVHIVDESLHQNEKQSIEISLLAQRCLYYVAKERPNMEEVYNKLLNLNTNQAGDLVLDGQHPENPNSDILQEDQKVEGEEEMTDAVEEDETMGGEPVLHGQHTENPDSAIKRED